MSKPAFDPSQPFDAADKPPFDPSKPFESKDYDWSNAPSDILKSNVDALPLYGQAAGSLLGPIGAGLGQAAGNSLKEGLYGVKDLVTGKTDLEDYFRAPTTEDVAQVTNSAMENFNQGAVADMGGQVFGKFLGKAPATLAGAAVGGGAGAYMADDGKKLEGAGKGMLIGGALGYGADKLMQSVGEAGVPFFSKGGKSEASAAQAQNAEAQASSMANAKASIEGGGVEVEQSGQPFSYKAPQNLDELRNWNPKNVTGDVLGKQRLAEIESTLPDLETKPLKYHYDMMEDPKAMKRLKLSFENLSGPDKAKIAQYNQSIVNESGQKIEQTVNSYAGNEPKSLADAGENFISQVKSKYDATKEALKPVFDQLKEGAGQVTNAEAQDLVQAIGQNTKIGKLLTQTSEGRFVLARNTPRTGVSDAEHSVLSRVIDDLNDGVSFGDIQKIREFLRKSVDPTNPRAFDEVGKVRSILLDYLEGMASKRGPGVGETFKKWAMNERALESVEKIIGGKIETLDHMFAANPEKVVQKIFANPNYVKVVEQFVGKDALNDMVGAYLKNGIMNKKVYDSATGFNPVALRQWLKTNDKFIGNFVDKQTAQRLNALADYGYYGKRFLDEVNPSGTAESLKAMIEPGNFIQKVRSQGIKGALESEVVNRVMSKAQQAQAVKATNEALGSEINPVVKEHLLKKLQGFGGDFGGAVEKGVGPASTPMLQSSPQLQIPRAADKQDDNSALVDKDQIMQKMQGTKYAQALQNAASKNDNSFAAAHFVLQSRDADYRKQLNGDDFDE